MSENKYSFPHVQWYRDGPLYLEWAPGNVLSPSSTTESIEKNNAVVGEHDVKRVMLEQYVGGIADVDVDPDRVEIGVCMLFFFPLVLFFLPHLSTQLFIWQTKLVCPHLYFLNAVQESILTIICTQLFGV